MIATNFRQQLGAAFHSERQRATAAVAEVRERAAAEIAELRQRERQRAVECEAAASRSNAAVEEQRGAVAEVQQRPQAAEREVALL